MLKVYDDYTQSLKTQATNWVVAHRWHSSTLYTKVRNRRHFLALTQEQLAERANFHVNYVGGIERAERNPSITSLIALARGLECQGKDLLPDN